MHHDPPVLNITFGADDAAQMGYLIAVHRAQELLGIDQLPPLTIKGWPSLHIFGPSASAAVLCAVVSLFTNRLVCRDGAGAVGRHVQALAVGGAVSGGRRQRLQLTQTAFFRATITHLDEMAFFEKMILV
ncbi:hypothetical protein niasHS_000741 [Heterodera schachtii]|uniref:Uncharacterized protein n=1 Tax=Heterodera schachtii TaxID=97005 RepID=A0ABD2KL50_HETSC